MDTIQENIAKIINESPRNIHAVFYGKKTTNGAITENDSIVYVVEKKVPANQIPSGERISKQISIDNSIYPTDVVEAPRFKLKQCYDFTDEKILSLQSKIRPISGGIQISSLDSWEQTGPSSFNYTVGTLGFLAKDNTDNTLVGVTTNHTVVKDAFINQDKDLYSYPNSIVDNIYISGSGTFSNRILQFNNLNDINFENDSIGYVKRFAPIYQFKNNQVDAAVFAINSGCFDASSAAQAYLAGTSGLKFATTGEINTLFTGGRSIYSVGRSTGPKGTGCPLVIYGIGSAVIEFNKQGNLTPVTMTDCLFYRFKDLSILPIEEGDSGSVLIGDVNGINKIVGLAYAGSAKQFPTIGIACRINNIVEKLNISEWSGEAINTNPTNPNYSKLIMSLDEDREFVEKDGKTYYLAGTILI